ncbi:MAG: Rieske 2Fe-2S domain-containing protein [Myxococcota bacterium]
MNHPSLVQIGRKPPSFEKAKNRRQKARAAGMDPNYWYAVEYDNKINTGQVTEVRFWHQSVALFRGEDGKLRALENRCAHRQLKLSVGEVVDNHLVCQYHGWCYDESGCVVDIPHETFGKKPKFRIRSYPVQVRYGLVWIFFGDVALSEKRQIPDIPELEGPDRWACVPIDVTWQAHHSMIIDNVLDFTHNYLHRRFRPFWNAKLKECKTLGDKIRVKYTTEMGSGRIFRLFVDRKKYDASAITLFYDYPYQRSDTDGFIKHWCFLLPIDERTTRAFFLFHFRSLKIPGLSQTIPRWLMTPFLHLANRLWVGPLLDEDGFALEAEQEGYEAHFDAPLAELNPAVGAFQDLTIRKWEEYCSTQTSTSNQHHAN